MKTIFEKRIPNDRSLDVYSNDDKTIGFDIEAVPPDQEYGGYIDTTLDEAHALADAIYAELGLGWLPYPENKPSIKDGGDVLCTMCDKDYEGDTWLAVLYYAADREEFGDENGIYTDKTSIRVLAISNIQPYHP